MRLYGVPPLDDANQYGNHREHQKDVNEAAQGVGSDHSQELQDQQQDRDRPEHGYAFSAVGLACVPSDTSALGQAVQQRASIGGSGYIHRSVLGSTRETALLSLQKTCTIPLRTA